MSQMSKRPVLRSTANSVGGKPFVVGRRVAMSVISLLLNLLWIVFGGLWMAFGWVIAAVVMAITIIGLPWARAAFSMLLHAAAVWLPGSTSRPIFRPLRYRHWPPRD